MPRSVPLIYDYVEVRPFGSRKGTRVKKVKAIEDPLGHPDRIRNWHASNFTWYLGYSLEGREHVADTEGCWVLTDLRIRRRVGDPGRESWPFRDRSEHPCDPADFLPRVRLHHYYRILSSQELLLLSRGDPIAANIAIEVTEEWHNPRDGLITTIPSDAPVIGSHAVGGLLWNPSLRVFEFPNHWGEEWGYRGFGGVSPEIVDRYLVESWGMEGIGTYPPFNVTTGLQEILWKCSWGDREIHGREIIDAATAERIGWCFLARRGGTLDIEELFVWPDQRGKGYGRRLSEMAVELASQMKVPLRGLVSYADLDVGNRPALEGIVRVLGLHLHPSPLRGVGFVALPEPYSLGTLPEPHIPKRPASTHDALDPETCPRVYTVWYGTNREPVDCNDLTQGFTGKRGNQTYFGKCHVSIPRSHRFGSVGSAWYKRWWRGEDDRLRITNRDSLSQEDMWQDINSILDGLDPSQRHGLVFIHGYNVSFDDAAIRAAQLGYDLKVPGVTAFYSWPSGGSLLDYAADETSIEFSEQPIVEFLDAFALKSGLTQLHLIAHSMGNRGLLRALARIAERASVASRTPLSQVIFAAPDVDAAKFKELARASQSLSQRCTLYASPSDRAVGASQFLHEYPRAGVTPPVTTLQGVDTVEIPSFNVFELLGHGYYAEAESLLHDIFDLMRRNAPPSDRQRLSQAIADDGSPYWVMDL